MAEAKVFIYQAHPFCLSWPFLHMSVGLASYHGYPVSGSWVMRVTPRIRRGHIFPPVVDHGANGKANGLKFSGCSFHGRAGVNYSTAAALCRGAPFLNAGSLRRRLLWGARISPSVSGFQKPEVKKINNRGNKNEKCPWFLNCRKSACAPKSSAPSRCAKLCWISWLERENIQILPLTISPSLERQPTPPIT